MKNQKSIIAVSVLCLFSSLAQASDRQPMARRVATATEVFTELNAAVDGLSTLISSVQNIGCNQGNATELLNSCRNLIRITERIESRVRELGDAGRPVASQERLITRAQENMTRLRRDSEQNPIWDHIACRPHAQRVRGCFAEAELAVLSLDFEADNARLAQGRQQRPEQAPQPPAPNPQ